MNYHLVLCNKYVCSFILHACLFTLGCTKYIVKHTNKLFRDEEFGLHAFTQDLPKTSILYHDVIIRKIED